MRSLTWSALILVALLAFAAPTAAAPDPLSVVNDWSTALLNGNFDAAVNLLADNPTVSIVPPEIAPPPGTYKGQAEVRAWLQFALSSHPKITSVTPFQASGDKVTGRTREENDVLKQLGVDFIEHDDTFTIQNGKIIGISYVVTPESLLKVQRASSATPGMPSTGGGGMARRPTHAPLGLPLAAVALVACLALTIRRRLAR
jgi:hypothetical protein